ncbi:unnamed protein product [Phaeothamnion confervicola]
MPPRKRRAVSAPGDRGMQPAMPPAPRTPPKTAKSPAQATGAPKSPSAAKSLPTASTAVPLKKADATGYRSPSAASKDWNHLRWTCSVARADDRLWWQPPWYVALLLLVCVRLLSAATTCIGDCDETFNYWEPLHYSLYGFGQQTWEYAPDHALRSWAFLMPSRLFAKSSAEWLSLLGWQWYKPWVWLGVKARWGAISAIAETTLYAAVSSKFGKRAGAVFLVLTATSAGMFIAATALLPSSTCMILQVVVLTAWLHEAWRLAVFLAVVATLGLGWPFVALLHAPLAVHCLISVHGYGGGGVSGRVEVIVMCLWGAVAAAAVFVVVTYIDSKYYDRWTSPNLNIFRYNVMGSEGRSDELYGTEPASFYVKNLWLNTTVAAVLGPLLAPLSVVVNYSQSRVAMPPHNAVLAVLATAPAVLWLAVMFAKPHKEERFLYPAYPSLFVGAAVAVDYLVRLGHLSVVALASTVDSLRHASRPIVGNRGRAAGCRAVSFAASANVLTAALFGVSRSAAVVRFYGAPCGIFRLAFQDLTVPEGWPGDPQGSSNGGGSCGGLGAGAAMGRRALRVCVGAEWYRFPSSFFLPNDRAELVYLRSAFRGQLPQPFAAPSGKGGSDSSGCGGTSEDAEGGSRSRGDNRDTSGFFVGDIVSGTSARPAQVFNDLNLEEPSRYGQLQDCDYIVEMTPSDGPGSPRAGALAAELVAARHRWAVVGSLPFLDAGATPPALRAFYVPFFSEKWVSWSHFSLFRRVAPDPAKGKPSGDPGA